MLGRPDVQRLLAEHGLRPSRALGQNFVTDPNTVRRIARLAGVTEGSAVVEIGAGLGSLTLALAEAGARVVAVEVDRGLVPVLREVVARPVGAGGRGRRPAARLGRASRRRPSRCRGPRVWWTGRRAPPLTARRPGRWWPTCRTTWPRRWWCGCSRRRPRCDSLLVMVQREVGERMAAAARRPGLRGGLGEGRLLGHGERGRAGSPPRSSCPGRRSSRRSSASNDGTSRRCRPPWSAYERLFAGRAGRLRAAPQDAAAIAGRRGRAGGLRRGRRGPRGPGRGAGRRAVGEAGRGGAG